jgi:hypothetical protein
VRDGKKGAINGAEPHVALPEARTKDSLVDIEPIDVALELTVSCAACWAEKRVALKTELQSLTTPLDRPPRAYSGDRAATHRHKTAVCVVEVDIVRPSGQQRRTPNKKSSLTIETTVSAYTQVERPPPSDSMRGYLPSEIQRAGRS